METQLYELAQLCGVLSEYDDVQQRRKEASVESLLAALRAFGVGVTSANEVAERLSAVRNALLTRGLAPVIIAWDGEPFAFDLTLPPRSSIGKVACVVELEGGIERVTEHLALDQGVSRQSRPEGFLTFRLQFSRGLNWGYHRLTVETRSKTYRSHVISAPQRAYSPVPLANQPGGERQQGARDSDLSGYRVWGCFLPLYALRTQANWGAGDFTDLSHFSQWVSDLGGEVVGTLPLLAAFLDEPCEPSPYAPASRLFWNELYVDVSRIAELSQCTSAADLVQSADFAAELARLRRADLVDYRPLMALKRRVLERLADQFFRSRPAPRFAEFQRWATENDALENYARFRAVYERRRTPWPQWPARLRDGRLEAEDFDESTKRYHLYAQWVASQQLRGLAEKTRGGLYLDLPLGVRPDGFDVWRHQDFYVASATVGAPPDAVFTKGQDWRFPPLHPERIRKDGYRHVRAIVQHHMKMCRLLRIDHVMGLHRLYWIPHGQSADQGVYVRYHADEFYAVLSLESHRHQTIVIGENLGTVPPEVNREMGGHALRRMYVVQYELAAANETGVSETPPTFDRPQIPTGAGGKMPCLTRANGAVAESTSENLRFDIYHDPICRAAPALSAQTSGLADVAAGSLASLNTHDMPMFAAWWRGEDISQRRAMHLLDEEEAVREWDARQRSQRQLVRRLCDRGWLKDERAEVPEIICAVYQFLAASEADLVLINLEDLWLETRPQNVPGTGAEQENWVRKARYAFEEFCEQAELVELLRAVDRVRRQGSVPKPASSTQTESYNV